MKISDVSKIFDISPETLRFIEQKGLVHPSRNAENGYRDYDWTAFNELSEYMKLRRLGLPVRAIVGLTEGQTLEQLLTELDKTSESIQQELSDKQLLLEIVDTYRRKLTSVRHNLGIMFFVQQPDYEFLSIGSVSGDVYAYFSSPSSTAWRKAMPFVWLACRCSLSDMRSGRWNTRWSLVTERRFVERLGLPRGELIKEHLYLTTYAYCSAWDDLLPTCEAMLDFAKQRGYEPGGALHLLQLFRSYDSKDAASICVQLLMPVRKL